MAGDPGRIQDLGRCPPDALFAERVVTAQGQRVDRIDGRPVYFWGDGAWHLMRPRGTSPTPEPTPEPDPNNVLDITF